MPAARDVGPRSTGQIIMVIMKHLHRITAPHFVAGIEEEDGIVTFAAPIVRYMIGWEFIKAMRYCAHKRWKLELVS